MVKYVLVTSVVLEMKFTWQLEIDVEWKGK